MIIYLAQWNQHAFKKEFIQHVHHIIDSKYGCRSKNGQDHLSYDELLPQPATSLQRYTQP